MIPEDFRDVDGYIPVAVEIGTSPPSHADAQSEEDFSSFYREVAAISSDPEERRMLLRMATDREGAGEPHDTGRHASFEVS